MSYSFTIFIGRLVADPELKTTASGVPVLSATIAVDRKYQADKNNRVADFHKIVAWRNTAEFIARFFKKGDWIRVTGELQNRSYTDSVGNKRYATELIVDEAGFVGDKKSTSNPSAAPAAPSAVEQTGKREAVSCDDAESAVDNASYAEELYGSTTYDPDDLPF